MSSYEDWLWGELVREHIHSSAPAAPSPASHRARHSRAPLAGGLAGLALAVGVALAITVGSSEPAFAVTRNADGSVTVTLQELSGVGGANAELEQLGVPVEIATVDASCQEHGTPAVVSQSLYRQILQVEPGGGTGILSLNIDPAEIPVGDTLVLAAILSPAGDDAAVVEPADGKMIAVGHFALYEGAAPSCVVPAQ